MRSIEIPTEPFVGMDGMYKQCENRFFSDYSGGLTLCMYFVFRKCAAVRLRLRIRTQYYIMVYWCIYSIMG